MELLLVNSGIVASLLVIYSVFVFAIARFTHDNSVMDIAYGPAFLFASGGALLLTETYALLPAVIVGCIAAWAIRLGSRILRKNLGQPEDARYAKWREEWLKRGRWYFWLRSYLQVNLLQVGLIFLISLPAILALSYPATMDARWLAVGFALFVFGLSYETIADLQLDRFLQRKRAGIEPAPLMSKGLFRFSRRPNYFGESLVWWGLALMVLPLPYGWLALISPLTITYIVTRITGPMLEQMFLEKYPEAYGTYQARTNYFIPWFPRS